MHESKHSALIVIAQENKLSKFDITTKEKSIKSSPNLQQLTIAFSGKFSILQTKRR